MAPGELRDELDEAFVRRQWAWQRAGWGLLAVVIVLALLGILGTSPLASKVEVRDVSSAHYEVEYSRWSRYEMIDRLHVRVHAPEASGEELQIAFSREWVENHNVRGSTPEADGGALGESGAVYSYAVEDWSQPLVVAFEVEPRKAFRNVGEITVVVGEGEPVVLPLWSWVHP